MDVRKYRRFVLPALLLASIVVFSSCASVDLRPPDLFLERIGIAKVGISGMEINVFFDVMNANDNPMHLKYMEYTLDLNDHRIGRGYVSEPVSLGEMERKKVKSTLKISFFKLPEAIKAVFSEKVVHAKVNGKFTVTDGGKKRQLPFDSEADIPVTKEGWSGQP